MYSFWQSRVVRAGALVLWMCLIFFLSAQPSLPNLTPGAPHLEEIAGHFGEYAVLATLWWLVLRSTGTRYPAVWALLLAMAYGVSDEFHQSFVPNRTPDPVDLALDSLGAATALAVASAWQSLRQARARQS